MVVDLISDNDESDYREEFQHLAACTSTLDRNAHQHPFSSRRLKRVCLSPLILGKFYSCTIEGILNNCIMDSVPGLAGSGTGCSFWLSLYLCTTLMAPHFLAHTPSSSD
ncbi:unnamed protein product [Lota lota]